MADLSALLQPDKGQAAIPLQLVDKKGFGAWLNEQPERVRQAVNAQGFKADPFQLATLPGETSSEWSAVLGVADAKEPGVWCLSKAADSLPEGSYRVAGRGPGPGPGPATLGWL